MARPRKESQEITEVEINTAIKLASASIGDITPSPNGFYMPGTVDGYAQTIGVIPDKLMVPREYHRVITMCYDFYQRGGIVATVVNRLTELSITRISNGQRKTSNEVNEYFDTVLHRPPSRLNRFIRTAALEYFLSGMVLPKVEWEQVAGEDLNPTLKSDREYWVPVVDLYPPKLVKVLWPVEWGKKEFWLQIPDEDIRMIKRGKTNKIKEQQRKFKVWEDQYPQIVQAVRNGEKFIQIEPDAILRKELSITEYPTPFLFNVLEALIYKQQIRRMDYAVASRVISAILLVTEGSDEFPVVEGSDRLETIKKQINWYSQNPSMMQRLFPLFSNHTTKLQWIQPDVEAMLNQAKYEQVNDEISEGLGFAKILITGESRNAQASEVSTWAIQPMMEELREMFLEWLRPLYEEAAERNGFRYTPEPTFEPIRLQDFIKTAAVFSEAFKEGNLSRTTRDMMLGINFESELENIKDEKELIEDAKFGKPETFPQMPYNITAAPGMQGRPPGAPKGGRPTGSQNVPINNRNRGVKPKGQKPVSKVKTTKAEVFEPLNDADFIDLVTQEMEERGLSIGAEDILPEIE